MPTSKPSAPSLILDLLLASSPAQGLSVGELVSACQLFDLSDNSVRVSLVRLASEGKVEAVGRGHYRLGPQAWDLAQDVATWRDSGARVRDWSGDWVMVLSANLGRSDRKALRRRERALGLLGFQEWEKGIALRPHNLTGTVDDLRRRLYALGLERQAAVLVASELDEPRAQAARALWDTRRLNSSYRHGRVQLEDWLARSSALPLDTAARECYLLGHQAIRQVIFDPLLPDPLVDGVARQRFFDTVRSFDEAGHAIWQGFFDSRRAAA
ncbi:MAG: PaaX family transcriptional regulator C-terminal domain-containing protein [Acidobacteriota bacterium]